MSPESMVAWLRLALESSVRACVLAAGVGAVLALAHIRSGSVRHAAWSSVLMAMLLMPALRYWLPPIAIRLPAPTERIEALPAAFETAWEMAAGPAAQPLAVAARPETAQPERPVHSAVVAGRQPLWPLALLVIYLLGVSLLLLRLVLGWLAMRRIVAVSRAIDDVGPALLPAGSRVVVFESRRVATPVTVGVVRPAVVLPAHWRRWPSHALRSVLAHEVAHVRRHDLLVALVARVNLCIFWFHPLAWWLERHLQATAEHACDDAGARASGESRRYAETLLDMSEAVRRAGRRVSWSGIGVHGSGLLGQRIDRVLRGDAFSEVSMTRKAIVALGCAAFIVASGACQRRVQELKEDPAFTARQAENRSRVEFETAARDMDRTQIAAIEASLQRNPEDVTARKKLLIFASPYAVPVAGRKDEWSPRCAQVIGDQPCIALRREHIVWLIQHHPDSDALSYGAFIVPAGGHLNDPAGYAEAKALWLQKAEAAGVSAAVLRNAAAFFERTDKPLAEQMLLKGQTIDPSGTWWRALGQLYAEVLLGRASVFDPPVVNAASTSPVYASEVRAKLDQSGDARLLVEAASWLNTDGGADRAEAARLARMYAERALAIDPASVRAHAVLVLQQQRERNARMHRTLRTGPGEHRYDAVSALPDAERFEYLPEVASLTYMWGDNAESAHNLSEAAKQRELAKKYAEELLALAPRFRTSDRYGTAIYVGNLVLAGVTFREGDGQKAGEYLVAASKAPANDELRYSLPGIGFQLLGYMLKFGIREPVVEFLDRVGRFNQLQGKYLLQSAKEIREGHRPLFYPREKPYYPGLAAE